MAGIIQNVSGSVPIVARRPPPEGLKAAKLVFTLTPSDYDVIQPLQLNAQNGLMMSQVVTLVVDNTANVDAIVVTHGALFETLAVPGGTQIIAPTFSLQGAYSLEVAAVSAPAGNIDVGIILLNYDRAPGSNSVTISNATLPVSGNVNANIVGTVTIDDTAPLTVQNTIINTTHNSAPVFSNVVNVSAGGTTNLTAAGNWILDSLDIAVEYAQPTAIGVAGLGLQLVCASAVIHTLYPIANFTVAGNYYDGASFNSPSFRSWAQGLILPRGNPLALYAFNFTNFTTVGLRVNISGYNAP